MEVQEAYRELNKAYLTAIIEIMASEKLPEINFYKTTIQTQDGGVYLLQLQHVSGPKIDLKQFYLSDPDKPAPEGL